MSAITTAVVTGFIAGVLFSADAASLPIPSNHPDPHLAAYYRDAEATLRERYREILDTSRPVDDRIKSFRALKSKYPEAAAIVAGELIRDPAAPVAEYAVKVLGASAVMSDHPHPAGGHGHEHEDPSSPFMIYMANAHDTAKAKLRMAIADPRPGVRIGASTTLASLSDEGGLKAIEQAAESGLCSKADAVGLMSLANSDVSAPYLNRYLESGDLSTKAAAVGALSAYPEFRDRIKTEYLLNSEAPLELRRAASRVIEGSPESFVPLLLPDSGVPPQLLIDGAYYYSKSNPRLSPTEKQILKSAVQRSMEKNPNLIIPKGLWME